MTMSFEMLVQKTDAQSARETQQQFVDQIKSDVTAGIQATLQAQREAALARGDQATAAKLDKAIAKLQVGPQPPTPPGKTSAGTQPVFGDNFIPQQAVDIVQALGTTLVLCVVGFPLARAFARRIDRRGSEPSTNSKEVAARLEAIEKAVESVAIEVERVSEGQRFTTKLLSERAHEPAREFTSVERDPVALPANARRS